MKSHWLAAILLVASSLGAWAQEQAFTSRPTELKASPDGAVVSSLGANNEVKVLQRAGGWAKVDASGKTGWVNVFHLRFAATSETTKSSGVGGMFSSLGSALGGRQTTQKTTIATVGIRGLSPDDLKNAAPDAEALKKVQSYRADKASAERFAREGKLADVRVDYAEGGR